MGTLSLVVVGLIMLAGVIGVLVPAVPGIALCWGGVLWWALAEQTPLAWWVLAGATAVALANLVLKRFLPGRDVRQAWVAWRSLFVAGLVGVVGFYVIPVIGLPVGFALGLYAMERASLGSRRAGWAATKTALRAIGIPIMVELLATLVIVTGWAAAVIFG